MPTDARDDAMESKNSWIEEGRKQGRAEALAEAAEALAQAQEEARSQTAAIVLGLLHRRFPVSPGLSARVEELSRDRLARLAWEVLDINTPRALDRWLREHTQPRPYGYALELTTSWKEEGRAERRAEVQEEFRCRMGVVVLRQLRRLVGPVSTPLSERVEALPVDQLQRLTVDAMDFTAPADLERWLDRN